MDYRRVFLGLLTLLLNLFLPVSAFSRAQVSSERGLRSFPVTVTNERGELIGGLTGENFLIRHGKGRCRVQTAQPLNEPLNVGFVVDTSGSMDLFQFREIARPAPIAKTISTFAELANPLNKYFLITVDAKLELKSDWTSDIKTLAASLPSRSRAMTALYDALAVAVEKVDSGPHRKSVIILFSDGSDNSSSVKFEKIRDQLKKSEVLLYASGIRDALQQPAQRDGRDVLLELTELTGGRTYFPVDYKQLEEMANLLATELHHQYRVAFVCNEMSVNQVNRIKVELLIPPDGRSRLNNLKVRARKWVL